MNEIITNSIDETISWAENFIKNENNCLICLNGNMGAGKTVIVKGIAKGLGIKEPVTSPTFTLIQEYEGKQPLYHFDLYRLQSADELFNLGLDEYLERDGIKIFEWSNKFDVFPKNHFKINIEIIDFETRKIQYHKNNYKKAT